jgi:hypothetical protein
MTKRNVKQPALNVLMVRPNEPAVMMEIEDSLEAMQDAVGGPIEMVKPWSEDVALICNEEGKLKNLPPNRIITKENGSLFGVIHGTFFLVLAPRNCDVFLPLPGMVADRYERYMVPYHEQ